MAGKVLGISTSPRLKGNSDLLLRRALAGAESAGVQVEYLRLADLAIAPCVECNACYKTGICRFEDDYQSIRAKMLSADRLIFATPIFFMGVCGQGKLLIDRCQCLWAHKYVLKKPVIENDRDRKALVIAVGGTRSKKMFECIHFTMNYFFDALEIDYWANLFVNNVDDKGQIEERPAALEEAFRLGKELAEDTGPAPDKPLTIEFE